MPNNLEKTVDVLSKAIDDLIKERGELYEKVYELRTERDGWQHVAKEYHKQIEALESEREEVAQYKWLLDGTEENK
jgi:uncharacterized coiled-coil DUF342 family protein